MPCQNCQNLHAGMIHVPHMRLPNTFRKDFAKSHDVVVAMGMPGRVENIHLLAILRLVGEFLGLPYDSSLPYLTFFALCKASTVAYYFALSPCHISRLQLKVGKGLVYRHLNYEA